MLKKMKAGDGCAPPGPPPPFVAITMGMPWCPGNMPGGGNDDGSAPAGNRNWGCMGDGCWWC